MVNVIELQNFEIETIELSDTESLTDQFIIEEPRFTSIFSLFLQLSNHPKKKKK